MRFNFLNGLDCPDWLLAQIAEISKMTTIKYKLLCGFVLNRLLSSCSEEADVSKYVNEALDELSIRRIMTSTLFILESAVMSATSPSDLILELEQLGLTSEHSRILSKTMESYPDLKSTLLTTIAKAPAVAEIKQIGDSLVMVSDSGESYRVNCNPIIFQALKRDMSRCAEALNKISQ